MARLVLMVSSLMILVQAVDPVCGLERRINTWLVCGTFSSESQQEFEAHPIDASVISPEAGMVSAGKPWLVCDDRLYCRNLDDYVDLYTFFNRVRPGSPAERTDRSAAYAHVYVWSPVAQPVQLRLGANDGYRVWLNGQLVGSKFAWIRTAVRNGNPVDLQLQRGWNRLLLKIHNGQGIWGFYAKLADPQGGNLDQLEYSIAPPEEPLRILTAAAPTGYSRAPYVWLEIFGAESEGRVPSASPFRLLAAGGQPPYRWKIASTDCLPPGLYLDGEEGELLGVTGDQLGEYRVDLLVEDAVGTQARRSLSIVVAERPTRWLEEGRLVGLIHGARGYEPIHGDPVQQAQLLSQQGYACASPTTGWSVCRDNWPGEYDEEEFWTHCDLHHKTAGQLTSHSNMSRFATVLRERGIHFGTYVGLPDHVGDLFQTAEDYRYWPSYQDAIHCHLQEMCLAYRPALFYLDGANLLVAEEYDWDFDALYSIVKTLSPASLLMPNLASYADTDYRVGDADVVSVEGNNDSEAYWTRWPNHQSSRNPKYIPIASWRYPFRWAAWKGTDRLNNRKPGEPDYMDWQQWAKVVVSLVGEGYICDLDHSFGYGREELHAQLGEWLGPRLKAIVGTRPGPLHDGAWGYDVIRENTVYLHLLTNPRGKTGLPDGDTLTVGPVSGDVRQVHVVPGGPMLEHRREGSTLTIDLTNVQADPVSTIVAIELDRSHNPLNIHR